ncbi:MAG: hypothetical protein NC311_18435 [Muribaculaceae bacterium]|nr:hypothetical protein [Muribaculaceae bacterium]
MIKTEHYGLKKPNQDDFYDVDIFNENADVIDTSLHELSEKQNNVRYYNALTDIDVTFDVNTPLVTVFQAMQPNSILNTTINQANSVYPSANGNLHLIKVTATEGSVQFLSSDGKLSTGAFTRANEGSGEVLANDDISFNGWQDWANMKDHQVRSYTTLEQIGLSDDDMAEDDFIGNLLKINNSLTGYNVYAQFLMHEAAYPHLLYSVLRQLEDDGIEGYTPYADVGSVEMVIERCGHVYGEIKIELRMDMNRTTAGMNNRARMIIAYANRDGDKLRFYSFKEVATTDYAELTLLNGWTSLANHAASAVKTGKYVNINFCAQKGVVVHDTVIFKLPEGFKPKGTVVLPLVNEKNLTWARLAIYTNGEAKLLNTDNLTGVIAGSGGFPI